MTKISSVDRLISESRRMVQAGQPLRERPFISSPPEMAGRLARVMAL
jgi:hypothetical protein